MTRTTTILCDCCHDAESGYNHASLWERLHRAGWAKGPRVENVTLHFCGKAQCRTALEDMRQRDALGRGARYRLLRSPAPHAHKEPRP